MATDLWLAFVLAAGVLLLLPGPTVLLIVGFALANGTRAALADAGGVAGVSSRPHGASEACSNY